MTNINDTLTDADYDKYFDEMNLQERERIEELQLNPKRKRDKILNSFLFA